MNITLLFTWRFVNSVGGAERVFCSLANAMVSRGHNVTALCFDYEEGTPNYPLDSRVRFINVGQGKRPPFYLSRFAINLRSFSFNDGKRRDKRVFLQNTFKGKFLIPAIKESKPDVIVCFQPEAAHLVHSLKITTPVIVMSHNETAVFLPKNMPPCIKESLRKVSAIQALMPQYVEEIKNQIPETQVVYIPNFVPQRADLADRSSHIIVNSGRIAYQKRQELLVDAFSLVANQYPDWIVKIWGGNDLEPERVKAMQKRINSLGMQKRILLCGVTQDIFSELKKASIFAFPSRHEGFSMALTEAMAVGIPSIGCKDCASVGELIQDGINGFLCEDNPQDFAHGLARLMNSEDLRIRLGNAAKEDMRTYAPDMVWDQWEHLLNSVVEHET